MLLLSVHRRVGENVQQDKPVNIQMMKALNAMFDREWSKLVEKEKSTVSEFEAVAKRGLWFNLGFCLALRGEEMIIVEFAGLLNSLGLLEAPGEGLKQGIHSRSHQGKMGQWR